MKEVPVLIFVMNDLGCRLDHTLSWDERVSGICYAPSIDAAVENGCLTADSLELGSLWICNTYFACPEIMPHTKKPLRTNLCPCPGICRGSSPLNRLRKAFADAVKFCDSLLGSAKIVPIGWGYLPHCLKKILLKIMGA